MKPATGGAMTADLARLEDAYKNLVLKWETVREQWQDGNAEAVEEQFLVPLTQIIGATVPAIGQMGDELAKSVRTCSEPEERW